jgi:hypothetical protein
MIHRCGRPPGVSQDDEDSRGLARVSFSKLCSIHLKATPCKGVVGAHSACDRHRPDSRDRHLMVYPPYGGLPIRGPVKRKVFVSYHHDGDQFYYDAFARHFAGAYEVFADNSLNRIIDSEDVEYVMRRIREDHICGSSCTVVLVGKDTPLRKYVDWEIMATLDDEHGLIGVQLPSAPVMPNNAVNVPPRLYDNINSGYALWLSWAQIMSGTQQFAAYIEQANARDKRVIANNRERRLRNG